VKQLLEDEKKSHRSSKISLTNRIKGYSAAPHQTSTVLAPLLPLGVDPLLNSGVDLLSSSPSNLTLVNARSCNQQPRRIAKRLSSDFGQLKKPYTRGGNSTVWIDCAGKNPAQLGTCKEDKKRTKYR